MQTQGHGAPNKAPHEGNHAVVAWSFVAVQALLVVAIVATPRDGDWTITGWLDAVAAATVVLGAVLGLWAALRLGRGLTPSPLPNGTVDMVTRGLYRWVRHPMYTALMLIVAGVTIRSGSFVVLAEAMVLAVLLNVKARWEERRLIETFPGYRDHQKVTGRFIPSRGGWRAIEELREHGLGNAEIGSSSTPDHESRRKECTMDEPSRSAWPTTRPCPG